MWLVFGLLSAISAAMVSIFGKLGLHGIDTSAATALRAIIMAVFLVLVALVQGRLSLVSTIFSDKKALSYIALSGISGALSWLFYFFALKFGKVSQVAPIDRLSVVFAIILAMIFLEETLSKVGAIGVIFITIGVIMVALS